MEGSTATDRKVTETPDVRHVGGPAAAGEGERDPRESLIEAAQTERGAKALTPEERVDALQWLLDDTPVDPASFVQVFEINVGTDLAPKIANWTIRSLNADEMNGLRQRGRQEAGMNRAQRRAPGGAEPEIDVTMLNMRMVALATVEPNLQEAAQKKGIASADPLMGPVELLKASFRAKPGIIDQIAARVMLFSGYDETDVMRATPEIKATVAAGN